MAHGQEYRSRHNKCIKTSTDWSLMVNMFFGLFTPKYRLQCLLVVVILRTV
jgi:hypothetical protein